MVSEFENPNVIVEPDVIRSNDRPLQGQYVTLEGLSRRHIPDLWQNLGLSENNTILEWLPWSKPNSKDDFWEIFDHLQKDRGFIAYAIIADPRQLGPRSGDDSPLQDTQREALGTIGYLDVEPQHRTVEVGAILYGQKLRHTAGATEAHYLLLRNLFEPQQAQPYRRAAWKNNSLNTASRRAAERVGYVYEGTWRNHMIVNGRSRDSDWLSIIDSEWPVVKQALQQWLDRSNFNDYGRQLKTLEEIRAKFSKIS